VAHRHSFATFLISYSWGGINKLNYIFWLSWTDAVNVAGRIGLQLHTAAANKPFGGNNVAIVRTCKPHDWLNVKVSGKKKRWSLTFRLQKCTKQRG